eukprot:EG_transcript_12810
MTAAATNSLHQLQLAPVRAPFRPSSARAPVGDRLHALFTYRPVVAAQQAAGATRLPRVFAAHAVQQSRGAPDLSVTAAGLGAALGAVAVFMALRRCKPPRASYSAWPALPPAVWAVAAATGETNTGNGEGEVARRCAVQLRFNRVIAEGPRPLVEYVQLPAKKYSVLDSKQVTRLSDDTFRVQFGDVRLLGLLRIAPSADVTVEVPDTGAIQTIRGVRFDGKPQRLIDAMNAIFARMLWSNRVTAQPLDDGNAELTCDISLDWTLPSNYPLRPEAMQALVTRLMNYMMPWMLSKLEQDYARWSQGDNTRSAVTQGEIARLTFDFMAENKDVLPGPPAPHPNGSIPRGAPPEESPGRRPL